MPLSTLRRAASGLRWRGAPSCQHRVVLDNNWLDGTGFFCACRGGAIFASGGATVNITGSTLSYNRAPGGQAGSVSIDGGSIMHASGTVFRDSWAYIAGACGMMADLATVSMPYSYVDNCQFINNTATNMLYKIPCSASQLKLMNTHVQFPMAPFTM